MAAAQGTSDPALPRAAVGREVLGELEPALRREWLLTDGTGSYAMGTAALLRTRVYHGLLVAALSPPVGRVLVCAGLVEAVVVGDRPPQHLHAAEWVSGAVDPAGFLLCEELALEGTLPVWRYALAGGVVVERRIWMPQGSTATCVEHRVVEAPAAAGPVRLRLAPLMAWRDHHAVMAAGALPAVTAEGSRLVCRWPWGAAAVVEGSCGDAEGGAEWYIGERLRAEAARGLASVEDVVRAGAVTVELGAGEASVLRIGVEGADHAGEPPLRSAETSRQAALLRRGAADGDPDWVRRLVLAADAFVVRRGDGRSVVAGYPWFGDWGRDTFIALPGLALETGRPAVSEALLRTFAAHVDGGMVPNRFPDSGGAPEYNTVDGTLWFVEALRRHVEATGDTALVDDLWPVLEEIVRWHRVGTRFGIVLDPDDGLLRAGEPGVQLTWMDAKVGDRVVTPRIGKPVEVNALWYSALVTLAGWGQHRASRSDLEGLSARCRAGFARFWNPATGCLADVLDGPDGTDASVRPNQLVAAALDASALDGAQAAAVVDVCMGRLRTSLGVRTLDPDDPRFTPVYGGGVAERDGAYHMGTAWPWLLGPLVAAHLRVHRDPAAARALLAPIEHHLDDAGLGSVSEVADGVAPHRPGGCPWQAWSVAEVLRSWRLCRRAAAGPRPDLPG